MTRGDGDTVPALFATYDLFPSRKGAGTHIAHNLAAMKKIFGSVHLLALGSGAMPGYQEEEGITIRRHIPREENFLERAECFARFIADAVSRMGFVPRVFLFRDIWSGVPLLGHGKTRGSLKIFEVNGLPSIELPYHYPAMLKNRGLMARIRSMEDFCLDRADSVITVSAVTKNHLAGRGVDPGKIHVIHNASYSIAGVPGPGGVLPEGGSRTGNTIGERNEYILYSGTLSPWQGIPALLKAFSLIRERTGLSLYLACSTEKYLGQVKKMIKKMNLGDRVHIKTGLKRGALWRLYREALFSVAPLPACARNIVQGCSPLKIIESMAAGTPVIASRIPVCSEIIDDRKDGMLTAPDSPRALAHAMELLWRDRELLAKLKGGAREKAFERFSRDSWGDRLTDIYTTITGRPMKRYE